jgi:hypothetical protein
LEKCIFQKGTGAFWSFAIFNKNWLVISGSYTIVRYTWPTLTSRMAIFLKWLKFFLRKVLFKVVFKNRTHHLRAYAIQSGYRKNGSFSHLRDNVSGKRFSVTFLWGGNF